MTRSEPALQLDDQMRRDVRHAQARRLADRHSRRVRTLKIGLPLAGLALIGGFLALTMLRIDAPAGFSLDGVGLDDGRIVMQNPKMEGLTAENRPYEVKAREAVQVKGSDEQVELSDISAKLPLSADETGDLTAKTGLLDNASRTLALTGGLVFKTAKGLTAQLQSADIDIEAGALKTEEPVDIRGDGTHISADSLQVRDSGKTMIFQRKVRVVIEPGKLDSYGLGAEDSGSAAGGN